MRQSKWAPSIIPEDQTVYLVLDDFGHLGQAWRETDVKDAELEAVITDLLGRPVQQPGAGRGLQHRPGLGARCLRGCCHRAAPPLRSADDGGACNSEGVR
jgi:hypothetical protein